ncbi:MAG: flagellin FliC5 [Lachnospiraceae bacterium]|nr:flagellin FliC5 [Lachnospiraceae bacterium]
MSSISGVSGVNPYGSSLESQIASGSKLQSAADGAAEMAIAEKENAQINGLDQGRRNAEDGKSLLNVADGAMSGIADNLQRIRELAIQASNSAILSDEDLQSIQYEIDQLKQGISDIANNTEFNKKKLLDGSYGDGYIQSGANAGQGLTLNIGAATLESLGIQDFDVTGDFSLQTIDDALAKVSSNRSMIGAQSNALDYTIAYNSQASINLTSAVSNLEDADIAKVASELDKQKLLQSYQIMLQKKQQEQEQEKARFI